MQYEGWNLEKTLLIASDDPQERPGELVDVRIAVDTAAAQSLRHDVRVVEKPAWNRIGRELPSQVYCLQEEGEVTTFRVAFVADLPAHGTQRVGILYDNPGAEAPRYETDLEVNETEDACRVENRHWRVALDPASRQPQSIDLKLHVLEYTHPRRVSPPTRVQPGVRVLFAGSGEGPPAWGSAAGWRDPRWTLDTGPLFCSVTCQARLAPDGEPATEAHPLLELRYKFPSNRPWMLCSSRLEFPADTPVFGIEQDVMDAAPDRFSHYCFRPVTPSLPETDVEEVGHVLVDREHTRDLPQGVGFGGFLPYDLAWHGFISCIRRPEFRFDYAWSSIRLADEATAPGGEAPSYRAAAYLHGGGESLRCCRAPVHVTRCDRRENVVWIPRGTVYRDTHAWHLGEWDEKKGWLNEVEALGRRLNRPPRISQHPVFLGGPVPPEPYELVPAGTNGSAYTKAGVR